MESVTDVLNWELVGGQLLVYRQNGHRNPNCTDAGKFAPKYPEEINSTSVMDRYCKKIKKLK